MTIEIFLKAYKLLPGEFILTLKPIYIDTILGSCVSITIFHPKTKLAMMSHSILPRCKDKFHLKRDCDSERFKFVDTTVEFINHEISKRFINKDELEIKIFGGANQINNDSSISVGDQNIKTALELLNKYGFQIKNMDVGGSNGRRVIFDTNTGEVWVKKLRTFNELNLCYLKENY